MLKTRAWVLNESGKKPDLQDIVIPELGPGEVLVRIAATGLNFADLLMIEGTYQDRPALPFVPGMEFAGVVEMTGPDVTEVGEGDRVMAAPAIGGLGGHAIVPVSRLRRTPESMDDITAAGFQIAYGTSHMALKRRARLEAGETVVVLGAAGGVGLTAVEIARHMGARVVAVARGSEKLEIARAAGAHVLIDSTGDDLHGALKEAGPVNVVFDAVGGPAGDAALRALGPEGRFLVIGFASGTLPTIRANHLLVKNQSVMGFYWGAYAGFRPEAMRESLEELGRWHATGLIRPHIGQSLPFERAMEGLALLRDRKATGKVIITR
jgi:NADPH2:quinone reductase